MKRSKSRSGKWIGLFGASALAFVGTSLVSAQVTGGSGGNFVGQANCSCAGTGIGTKVACFSCCTQFVYDHTFTLSPDSIAACFEVCGLERRSSACTGTYSFSAKLPRG